MLFPHSQRHLYFHSLQIVGQVGKSVGGRNETKTGNKSKESAYAFESRKWLFKWIVGGVGRHD